MMKAVVYNSFGGALSVETVADPTPPDDGVVIRVAANGICRSDWHGWQGHDGDIKVLPHVPGHELVGTIATVGKDVKRWRVDDRVTVPFCLGCGTCPQCVSGNHQVCDDYYQPGFTGWGAFAEYVALPYADVNLVRVPESMDDVEVASLGCRFTTSFRAVVAQGRVQGGEWVAVHGCGGVGLSAIMIAKALGATVIAIDINDQALKLAQQVGAAYTLNAQQIDDIPEAIHELTKGGAHVSLDALGSAITCSNSILGLRTHGRHVQVGLLKGKDENPRLPMGPVIGKELEIYGSHGMQAHAYDDLLRMIANEQLKPMQLVTQRVSLTESPAVLERMTNFGTVGITVIDSF